jgi:3-dehydroquinate synthase
MLQYNSWVHNKMKIATHHFPGKTVRYYFDADINQLTEATDGAHVVLLTDEHIYALHHERLSRWPVIVIPAGEQHKQQATIDRIIVQLIEAEADRKSILIGVGGGVVTDMAGYAASIYMRGIAVGYVPTTILGMVDAAIGGKNGVDVGLYKNLAGTIRQPDFLFFDYSFLQTLPQAEWVNGFAEVIKHACIKDRELFTLLQQHTIATLQNDPALLRDIIERNVAIKTAVVLNDERETGERRLLNFGHTLGHAIENLYQLPHGHAISIGMAAACTFSEEIAGFASVEKQAVLDLLQRYGLPVSFQFDKDKAFDLLKMDKKRERDAVHFILLKQIGEAFIQSIGLVQLRDLVEQGL